MENKKEKYPNTFTVRPAKERKHILGHLRDLAEKEGLSTNNYVENILIDHLKRKGIVVK